MLVPFDAAIPNRNESDISTVSEYIAIYNRQFGQDRRPFIQVNFLNKYLLYFSSPFLLSIDGILLVSDVDVGFFMIFFFFLLHGLDFGEYLNISVHNWNTKGF